MTISGDWKSPRDACKHVVEIRRYLNGAHVDSCFEQVRREAVPQRMNTTAVRDAGSLLEKLMATILWLQELYESFLSTIRKCM